MKRAVIISIAVALVLAASLGIAAAKINFTGTWVMDRSRSIGLPPGVEQTMTVVHSDDDKIQLETKVINAQGERIVKDNYTLDGKEAEFTPPPPANVPGAPAAKGRRTGTWLPRGNGIVITEETVTETPTGPVKNQLTRKWTLAPDGVTLTIDMYFDGPNGSFETRRVFVKK
jgi:hypothetical protein